MKSRSLFCPLALSALVFAGAAQAQVRITEVAPWSSGNSPVAADWFELTNFGASAVDISGWRVDDNSFSFAASVALTGITSIAPGESVIFIEGAAANTNFVPTWFGPSGAPAGLQIGRYSGSGIGLSTGGDAVVVFNTAGTELTRVSFGTSSASAPFRSFDNSFGLTGVTITDLSANGINNAFVAFAGGEIGSPGLVPEPGTWAMLLAGAGIVGAAARRRRAA